MVNRFDLWPRQLADLARRQQEYLRCIEPIIHQMAKLEVLRPPPLILLHPDGRIQVGPPAPLPPAAEAALEQARQTIAAIRAAYFPDVEVTAPAFEVPPPSR